MNDGAERKIHRLERQKRERGRERERERGREG